MPSFHSLGLDEEFASTLNLPSLTFQFGTHSTCALRHPYHRPSNTLRAVSDSGHKSPPAPCTDPNLFSRTSTLTLTTNVPAAIQKSYMHEALRENRGRRVRTILAVIISKQRAPCIRARTQRFRGPKDPRDQNKSRRISRRRPECRRATRWGRTRNAPRRRTRRR